MTDSAQEALDEGGHRGPEDCSENDVGSQGATYNIYKQMRAALLYKWVLKTEQINQELPRYRFALVLL